MSASPKHVVPAATPLRTTYDKCGAPVRTVDTVKWGIFDYAADPVMTMKSGETVTVEVISHHSGHEYAKMIRGDTAVEEVYKWYKGQSLTEKATPKTSGSGVHICTGPIKIEGAEPGDYLQVEILDLEPRPNPDGRTFGTNSQKFAGYQFRVGHADGTPYPTRDGALWADYSGANGTTNPQGLHEAITVFEFIKAGNHMAWGKPVYMYQFPTVEDAGGELRNYDGMPGVVIPHEFDHGYNGAVGEPVSYPAGFDGTKIIDDGNGNAGVINYLDVDLNWKIPLRPHLGIIAVMPATSSNYENGKPGVGGANTIPPSKFGGNIDNWRIGKGATMYYEVEVDGAMLILGDTHAAQGDSELAGTAMETSMTTKLKVTLHKKDQLPSLVQTLTGPLLETYDSFVITGYAVPDYLSELADNPSSIFSEGASVDSALADAFKKTRTFMMDYFEVTEEESIVIMATSVEFGITQIVDGNWGVHAIIPKWVFDGSEEAYDYSCTQNTEGTMKTGGRARKLQEHGVSDPEAAAEQLFFRITAITKQQQKPVHENLMHKWVDAKIKTIERLAKPYQQPIPSAIKKALLKSGTIVANPGIEEEVPDHGKIALFQKGLV